MLKVSKQRRKIETKKMKLNVEFYSYTVLGFFLFFVFFLQNLKIQTQSVNGSSFMTSAKRCARLP